MTTAEEPEIPLLGGDVTEGLVRVADTVRRPGAPASPAIAAYLHHLEQAGIPESPRHLGVDAKGRDILTFVEGETAGRPMHAWAAEPEVLTAIASLQRRMHDASPLDLMLPADAAFSLPTHLDGVPDAWDVADVIGHNDLTPDNLIFRDRQLVGVIDFDMAGPTTRLVDIVTTLLFWAPLRDPVDRDPVLADADAADRMRRYADAYGLDSEQRQQLYDVAVRRQQRSWHVMKHAAETRGGGWQRMWDEGVGDVILRSQRWLAAHEADLRAALAPAREDPAGFAAFEPSVSRQPAPDDLVVRTATAADLDACAALVLELNGGQHARWRASLERTSARQDAALMVADVNGEIAGYARIAWRDLPDDAAENAAPAGFYLLGLVVAGRWRRRGIAEALTLERLQWAWARSDRVFYFASADNLASLAVHERLGFRELTRDFTMPGLDYAPGGGVLACCRRP